MKILPFMTLRTREVRDELRTFTSRTTLHTQSIESDRERFQQQLFKAVVLNFPLLAHHEYVSLR
jgi:uncharacterized protein YceH (UPF0502 family)